ncbi:response regulator receiver (CheY-like) modulated metal dependent phosphohydrolase [Paramagnetospirillum magnetotacticum MS-1]|uniref:Response regulator receiver (CheY-like) modulated metal dependent phosphohydrolase n=2 Tax=Paramagnetospirillum magnetotacticum TaxID=188 RepID=A0A0C2U7A2_PARME|nr:response regulator receiver (CheY-like) modulated metal dependent phosphohydrolase [Paramagnetospirillum magnetotacticum MS-1]
MHLKRDQEMTDMRSRAVDLLVVEDNPADARLIELLLSEVGGIMCRRADCLGDAIAKAEAAPPDAVLLDLSLPDAHGIETVERFRAAAPTLPIVICTGLDDESMGLLALQHGCQDYLVKGQGDGNLIRRTILYAIERKAVEEERRTTAERLKRVLLQTVRSLSLTLEMRDPYTTGHQRRVAQLSTAIGRRMGLSEMVVEGLRTGGLLHDIGKIHIPAEFLSRPGKLSVEVHKVIRMHPQMGWEIMKDIEFPWPVAEMIRQHHERLDGSGYPLGLKGDEIILESRIIAVADVLEAISSHRPYRPALGLDVAVAELREHSGSRYDPAVVQACIDVVEEKGASILDEDPAPQL